MQSQRTLREQKLTLDPLFNPRSIAIVGASRDPKKWGFHLVLNTMKGGYAGRIYPVNAREKEILGLRVYPTLTQIPEVVDLALLLVPPTEILKVLTDCEKNGAKFGVAITAGFGEISREGKTLEEEMVKQARGMGMGLVGTLARILKVKNGRYGLANACIGGGQGAATIIERVG
jgi:acyl-CoA synthetase (NDP forming)